MKTGDNACWYKGPHHLTPVETLKVRWCACQIFALYSVRFLTIYTDVCLNGPWTTDCAVIKGAKLCKDAVNCNCICA